MSINITKIEQSVNKIYDFGVKKAMEARAFHETLKEYQQTPLVKLDGLAEDLGLKQMYVKDESKRFGLNAFKGLGGSYAMSRLLNDADKRKVFVTTTDGNHGRGVAWAGKNLGQEVHVYMPAGSAQERLQNIRNEGAFAEITDMQYDDCVRYTEKLAKENGWTLIQDTAWDGYEEIPAMIMQGYTTMGLEIIEQLKEVKPTHIFLQAGVGAMAGALTGFFADAYQSEKPIISIVEPSGADCIYQTAKAADGNRHFVYELHTIMAGLSCGEPCTIGWKILERYADYALSCDDSVTLHGMKILAEPIDGDEPIYSGESGAVTTGIVAEIMKKEDYADIRKMLQLDASSIVLCISTEGPLEIIGAIGVEGKI